MANEMIECSRGFVLAVSAPSGTGKTSLCDKLAADLPYVRRSISATTRPQRQGEVGKQDYEFVSVDEFKRLDKEDYFLETAQVFQNWYGTPRIPVEKAVAAGQVIVMDIDTVGALRIQSLMPRDTVLIFVVPPSLAELENRLKARGKNSPEDLAHRLKMASLEISEATKYDYIVENHHFEQAYDEMRSIVIAERQKLSRLNLKLH